MYYFTPSYHAKLCCQLPPSYSSAFSNSSAGQMGPFAWIKKKKKKSRQKFTCQCFHGILGVEKIVSVAWMDLGGFHGANMKFLWIILTLSLGRRGGQSWGSLSLKVHPWEIRERADLSAWWWNSSTPWEGLDVPWFGMSCVAINKPSISLLSFAISSSQMYALLWMHQNESVYSILGLNQVKQKMTAYNWFIPMEIA